MLNKLDEPAGVSLAWHVTSRMLVGRGVVCNSLDSIPSSCSTTLIPHRMSRHYAETHNHPSHIDIPPMNPGQNADDDEQLLSSPGPSDKRPPPPRGILKNAPRRPSQRGEGEPLSPTDEARGVADER